ncbi:rhomboid family intramembrane serine protease [Streptomyces sp. NPDC054796]|uniref:Rhomboid family intramembrane serine protease n=1 Tax=Streptomyces daliensis TaxID=299421 RepID=A0A8T4IMD7_9ACTN|nr:rhomboid family intramembrane serine protease [Streptomyces daliensis]
MEEQQHQPQRSVASCYRHPDRETGIRCARCERPICPECMIPASVGFQCPECVRTGSGTGHSRAANQPRTLAGGSLASDPRLVTKILLGVNVAVFVAVLALGDRIVEDLLLFGRAATEQFGPVEGVAEGQWYRLLTSAFLHQEPWHIIMNMLGLWFLGPPLEAALGRVRFTALYLLAALGGSALTFYLASPGQGSLGASGAIFGLFGATAVLMRRLQYDMRPILILLAINLVFTFTWSGIAWEAHIGGLVTGAVIAYAMVHAPREKRTLVQYGACAAMLLVIVAVCVVRTLQLTP